MRNDSVLSYKTVPKNTMMNIILFWSFNNIISDHKFSNKKVPNNLIKWSNYILGSIFLELGNYDAKIYHTPKFSHELLLYIIRVHNMAFSE